MTNKLRELYKELAESSRPNTMAEHNRIARDALVAGGVPLNIAINLVKKSLLNLAKQGVTKPTKIPWY